MYKVHTSVVHTSSSEGSLSKWLSDEEEEETDAASSKFGTELLCSS